MLNSLKVKNVFLKIWIKKGKDLVVRFPHFSFWFSLVCTIFLISLPILTQIYVHFSTAWTVEDYFRCLRSSCQSSCPWHRYLWQAQSAPFCLLPLRDLFPFTGERFDYYPARLNSSFSQTLMRVSLALFPIYSTSRPNPTSRPQDPKE